MRFWPVGLVVLGIAAAGLVAWRGGHPLPLGNPEVPFSEVAAAIARHEVTDLSVTDGGGRLVATLRTSIEQGKHRVRTVEATVPSRAVSLGDLERWSAAGARVRVAQDADVGSAELLLQVISVTAVLGLIAFACSYPMPRRSGTPGR